MSEMVFQPMSEDNGKLVTCSVTTGSANGVGSAALLKDSWRLDVKRKTNCVENIKKYIKMSIEFGNFGNIFGAS